MSDKLSADNISFGLRSDKVRNLMGEMPSYLIRYGVFTIVLVLLVFFVAISIIPYKKVYTGEAIVHEVLNRQVDSLSVTLLLKFDNQDFIETSRNGAIFLDKDRKSINGKITNMDKSEYFKGQRLVRCLFGYEDFEGVSERSFKFRLIISNGSFFNHVLLQSLD